MIRHTLRCTIVGLTVCLGSSSAHAEIVQYLVEFAQSGTVALGSTLDWTVSAVVTDSTAGNFGIRTAAVDLSNDTGETMSAGTIGAPFADYQFPQGGVGGAGTLTGLGAAMITYSAAPLELVDPANGGSLGPVVLATGSYQVNTLGLHTLSTVLSASNSNYFTAASTAAIANYDSVLFGSDSVMVAMANVPEPASMMLVSTFLGSIVVLGRRRRQSHTQTPQC